MPRLQVNVSETLERRIENQAEKDGVKKSEFVRTACRFYLNEREKAEK
jgi:metal-responsive CopG/Arc/MetJ family transcriptional regulator